jgi:hypothetical protein
MSGVHSRTFVDEVEGSLFTSIFAARFDGNLQDGMFFGSGHQSKSQLFCHLVYLVARMGSNSQRVLYKPDRRTPSVRHFSKDLVSVAKKVTDAHSKPDSAVKTRKGFLADEAGLLTLDGAFVGKALLDLRQSRCQLHRHFDRPVRCSRYREEMFPVSWWSVAGCDGGDFEDQFGWCDRVC